MLNSTRKEWSQINVPTPDITKNGQASPREIGCLWERHASPEGGQTGGLKSQWCSQCRPCSLWPWKIGLVPENPFLDTSFKGRNRWHINNEIRVQYQGYLMEYEIYATKTHARQSNQFLLSVRRGIRHLKSVAGHSIFFLAAAAAAADQTHHMWQAQSSTVLMARYHRPAIAAYYYRKRLWIIKIYIYIWYWHPTTWLGLTSIKKGQKWRNIENKPMRYPQQLGRSWNVFVPQPFRTLFAMCTGTVQNLIRYLHQNPPEPHQLSAPEPSGTLSAICAGTLQNLVCYLHRNLRNLVCDLRRNPL